MRNKLDISSYLIVGKENTQGRSVSSIVRDAVKAGFTCVQIRSKTASVRELIADCAESALEIQKLGKSDSVALLINDRLDVALACREQGIKLDGIHVGQDDIPVSVCRKYLGPDAIVGLSAKRENLVEYVKNLDISDIDYFGAGPLHKTATKADAGILHDGTFLARSKEELSEIAKTSKVPVVVGGGVTITDIPLIMSTGVAGFFVVSAVAGAENPYKAACELVNAWHKTGNK